MLSKSSPSITARPRDRSFHSPPACVRATSRAGPRAWKTRGGLCRPQAREHCEVAIRIARSGQVAAGAERRSSGSSAFAGAVAGGRSGEWANKDTRRMSQESIELEPGGRIAADAGDRRRAVIGAGQLALLCLLLVQGLSSLACSGGGSSAPADPLVVDSLLDGAAAPPGAVTLRDALEQAASGQAIQFDPSLDGGTIALTIVGAEHTILQGRGDGDPRRAERPRLVSRGLLRARLRAIGTLCPQERGDRRVGPSLRDHAGLGAVARHGSRARGLRRPDAEQRRR